MRLPWGRPPSLRGRLLRWLVAVNLLAMVVTAWLSYLAFDRSIQQFMDDQMLLVARSHATRRAVPPLDGLTGEEVSRRGAMVVQVWTHDGSELLASSWPEAVLPLQATPGFHQAASASEVGGWRVYTAPVGNGAASPRIQVLQSHGYRLGRVVRRALWEGLPILLWLPVALCMLWAVVSTVSRSLREVASEVATQDERSPSGLSLARVPEEIAPLVAAFNGLLARMRTSMETQQHFVQDAAHELRTPVAAVRLQIDNLRAHVPAGEAASRFAQLEAGVLRTQHLVVQLLALSRQEAPPDAAAAPVDVALLLRETLASLLPLADRRGIDVGFEGTVAVFVRAPVTELRSVFDNLVDNAIRYAPEGGTVDVRLHAVAGRPVVDVVDDGPGIAPALRERVFDRFFRVAGAPSDGSGLGLAIARAAAQRHGLRIELLPREGRTGLVARVYLAA
ncbi:sensor histidine kinase [Variovorax ginsengisoli]|uniref:histidine kinase n=1 Tax=Variovorax ginsengisoli TaxID=363844 RepID=A0ABT9SCG3_9BURK|nr:ATP-binding protein [Variovorax ginsengisoli]MDP9902034.1 signal transduction histidine kinase [Variovorax ginsengisoli]